MIPANAAQSAIDLAQQLEAAGRRVVAAPDSLLAKLTSVSSVAFKANTQGMIGADLTAVMNAEYTPNAAQIEAESRCESVEHETLSQHDVLMDSAISDMAQAVGQHLTFAKNTVRPLVKKFVDDAAAALAAYPDTSTYSPTVHRVSVPTVAGMNPVQSEAEKFKSVAYMPLNTPASLPACEGNLAIALMTTGSEAVDSAIQAWVQEKGESFFQTVYTVFFCASAPGISMTPEQMLTSKLDGADAATAAFLMGRHLLDNIPEGTTYGLADYRMTVGTIVEQCGQRLCTAYQDSESNEKAELLILSFSKDDVWVNAPVYDKWLAEGGNTALLFGNLLLDRPNLMLPAMLADSDKALQAWEQYNRFLNTTVQNRRHDAAKDTLRFVTQQLVAENIQDCFGQVAGEGVELTLETPLVKEAVDRALSYIDFLDMERIQDLWSVGTEVVAGTIFSYSAAVTILRGIERAVKANPEIDPSEAALLSTIEYVSNWVVDQIQLRDL